MDQPRTQYARSGDVAIAYQVLGEGPIDLVYVPPMVSNVEISWEFPPLAHFYRRLASFSRLIIFDKRDTGLSDRVPGSDRPALEERMDDVRAVMDAAGSERAALFGASEGGPVSVLFATTYPDRATALVLFGARAKMTSAPDYEVGFDPETLDQAIEGFRATWGEGHALGMVFAGGGSHDDATQKFLARLERLGATPGALADILRAYRGFDVRFALSTIQVPTLVGCRADDPVAGADVATDLAERIPGARLVLYPGSDHVPWLGDTDVVVDDTQEFVTGVRGVPEPDRVLATVLFTDIVGSSERASELGDRRWRDLLTDHYAVVRRELERFRGREINTAGDGFLATFDGPARAIRAACSIRDASRRIGLPIRAGVHTGECELIGSDVGGIAVHIGARVASEAGSDEVLVSNTVKDLVVGSDLAFEDRGVRPLKGIPGEWRLFAVRN